MNIGIPEKNLGTVSDLQGQFVIAGGQEQISDSIKVSMVGYESQTFCIPDLNRQHKPITIYLLEKPAALAEVTITAKERLTKILGNTTTSKFMSIGLPLKFLGSETGIKIRLGEKAARLKALHFFISENRLDTAVFRFNIYRFIHGAPAENILRQNIFLPIGKQTGAYSLDLSPYHLVEKGDLLISLEWVEGSASSAKPGAIFLSAGFLSSATWHRLTSQAAWKKAAGIGVGFNLEIQR